ncbi:KAP family P-loop NTPase fold protein [Hoeflea sp.]|uniref:KAP family P-loop NTPase fold protein n=1 Tax=Hoeflea sp. TaxID=1940281 RepID=UPI003BB0A037
MTSNNADVWKDDLLGRKQDAEFLYNFLIGQVEKRKSQGRIGSYVINIDSDWGGGKTFFLERFAKDIAARDHMVVEINAWRDDYAEDPYIAIMAAIDRAFAPYTSKGSKVKSAWDTAKKSGGAIAVRVSGSILKNLAKKTLGVDADEIAEVVADEVGGSALVSDVLVDGLQEGGAQIEKFFDDSLDALVDGFNRTNAAMTDFREKLELAVKAISVEKTAPVFILVDELDRCRPTYAVQLLERVKHLFDVPGVVFVFGTNTSQLQHSIAGAYGARFDGFRYLKRFFDRTYAFEAPSIESYVEGLCQHLPEGKIRSPEDNLSEVLTLGFKAYDFDLRAISQIMEMIDATASAWRHKAPIEIALLFPLCAHFFQTGKAEWPQKVDASVSSWQMKRLGYDHFSSEMVNNTINFDDVYTQAIAVFSSMEKIMKRNSSRSDSATRRYVDAIFRPEWNGITVQTDQPSIQTELLGLVVNAGKMQKSLQPAE